MLPLSCTFLQENLIASSNEVCRFRALLMYLFADNIKFVSCGSEEDRESASAEIITLFDRLDGVNVMLSALILENYR